MSMEISTTRSDAPRRRRPARRDPRQPGFGNHFTDHMFTVEWTPDAGWHDARIEPYGPLTLDPATAVLHYAQEIFEGMKAYRHADGSIWSFRPEENAARMARSSHRLALPVLAVDDFVAGGRRAGARSTSAGCPTRRGRRASTCGRSCSPPRRSSASGPAQHVTFMVIASPAGAYFKGGVKPVTLWLSDGVHPRRPRRHGRGQDRRQLRQLADRAAGGHRRRAATRWSSSTPRSRSTSRSSAA